MLALLRACQDEEALRRFGWVLFDIFVNTEASVYRFRERYAAASQIEDAIDRLQGDPATAMRLLG